MTGLTCDHICLSVATGTLRVTTKPGITNIITTTYDSGGILVAIPSISWSIAHQLNLFWDSARNNPTTSTPSLPTTSTSPKAANSTPLSTS